MIFSNEKKEMKNKESISLEMKLFGLSFFIIFLSNESTFSIQSISLIVVLALIVFIYKNRKIRLNTNIKLLTSLAILYGVSSVFTVLKYQLSGLTPAIQMLYQLVILIWFILMTNEVHIKKEINFVINCYIGASFICSVLVLVDNFILGNTVFAIKSILGHTLDKNFFSAFICISAVLALRKILYEKNKKQNIVIFLVISTAILFSNSRASLIGLFLGIFMSIIMYLKNKVTVNKVILLVIFIVIGVMAIQPIMNLIPSWMFNRYFSFNYEDNSNIERISMWKNALDGFKKQPIIGYGPGNLTSIDEYSKTEYGSHMGTTTMSHNTYIDALVNGGIIGFIIFITFLGSIFIDVKRYDKLNLPLVLVLIFTSFIVGAGKSVFFWNTLILLKMEADYFKNKPCENHIEEKG